MCAQPCVVTCDAISSLGFAKNWWNDAATLCYFTDMVMLEFAMHVFPACSYFLDGLILSHELFILNEARKQAE
jgi:hypothetical protein